MGRDLKGKEIGSGLRQRKDGKYVARFLDRSGKRPEKSFNKLSDAKSWLNEQRYLDTHTVKYVSKNITLNEWYEYWIENIKNPTVRISTTKHYESSYNRHIRDRIGNMALPEILPLHCQMVFNEMEQRYSTSTMSHVKIVMHLLFNSAVENGLLDRSPMTNSVKVKNKPTKERRVFTAEEQKMFVEYLIEHNHKHADEFIFCLETGIRVGELCGLMWSDCADNKIAINRSISYVEGVGYVTGEPKTKAGKRTIPLTSTACRILKNRRNRKVVSQYVFLDKHGDNVTKPSLNSSLIFVCKKLGIPKISMHGLRHSFATRCIERGMNPKTLQKIMGHSSLSMTMDLYVHVTDEMLAEEMKKMENGESGENRQFFWG